ncbi:MAG: DMT family transporter [Promethearchaeia archaeon]
MEDKGKYSLLLLMITIWALSFIMVNFTINIMPPLSLALYRFIIASLTFIIIDIVIYLRKKNKIMRLIPENNSVLNVKNEKLNFTDWILLILASFSGISIFFYAQYNSINLIGPSLPALFVCLLSPVLITLLALIFFKESLNFLKIIGFIIATIGGFLLVTGGDIETLAPKSPNFLGLFLAFLTPILWSIYSIITKKISKKLSNIRMLKIISYLGTIELFILVFIFGELKIFFKNFLNPLVFIVGIYLGVGCYVIGYYIWQYSQKNMKSLKVASFLYIEPFITLLIAIFLEIKQIIDIENIIGGIIVLFALFIINYDIRNEK